MFNESSNISLVKEFGGFQITRKGEAVPLQLPNRFVYAVRSVKWRLERMSAYVNVL